MRPRILADRHGVGTVGRRCAATRRVDDGAARRVLCLAPVFPVEPADHDGALSGGDRAQRTATSLVSVVALPCSLFLANSQNYSAAKWLVALVAAFGGLLGMLWFARGFRNATSSATRSGGFALLLPYCVLYGLVGAQLAWSLRPFIGSPSVGFTLFRSMGGNLLENLF